MWWVFPAGVVAAAAATIGVLALAGSNDEAVRQEPAVTPPVTVAPTVPATAPPTSAVTTTPPLPVFDNVAAVGVRGRERVFGHLR